MVARYSIRPIYVEDMARLVADATERHVNEIVDAVGPETFTFKELVRLIAARLENSVRLVHVPTLLAYQCTRLAGLFLRDIVLTWEEYKGLMSNLLASEGPTAGETRLTQWLLLHREELGRYYASELARHFR
jgi:hypothetical protein